MPKPTSGLADSQSKYGTNSAEGAPAFQENETCINCHISMDMAARGNRNVVFHPMGWVDMNTNRYHVPAYMIDQSKHLNIPVRIIRSSNVDSIDRELRKNKP